MILPILHIMTESKNSHSVQNGCLRFCPSLSLAAASMFEQFGLVLYCPKAANPLKDYKANVELSRPSLIGAGRQDACPSQTEKPLFKRQ